MFWEESLDHSENDKRFCVYVHKDEEGNIRYVGSGTLVSRPYSKENRSKEHKEVFDSLFVEIVADNLTKSESLNLEQVYLNSYFDSGLLFNKIKNVTTTFEIDYEYLSGFVKYDENSPTFLTSVVDIGSRKRGRFVGCTKPNSNGYIRCGINNTVYLIHRVIYCLFHKINVPTNLVIDHIDGNKTNNHPSNLRVVTRQENNMNTLLSKRNKSGKKGVIWHKTMNLWMVHWKINYVPKTKSFRPDKLYPELPYVEAKEKAYIDACNFRDEIEKDLFKVSDNILQEKYGNNN